MNKEIFSDPEYFEDIAVCLHKMMGDNKSLDALRKAHTEAFIDEYMIGLDRARRLGEKDAKSAADLLFPDWLKTIDIRDYFFASDLLSDLLKGMSANELKLLLADEMEVYYRSFRENAACSVFEKEKDEPCHKAESDQDFIDLLNEVLNDKSEDKDGNTDEDEDEDEDIKENDGVEKDEDYDDDWDCRRYDDDEDDKDEDEEDEDKDEEDELEKLFNAVVKKIYRSLRRGGKKNENKSN